MIKTAVTEEYSPSRPFTRSVVIEILHLHKSFGSHPVLQDFNLTLCEEENLVVLGRSGSGKSVLIKCIVGLIPTDAGEIYVLGKNVAHLERNNLDDLRRKIGFLFQWGALYDSMTVRENLCFPLRKHSRQSKQEINMKVEAVLESVGLPEAVDLMPSELSGGMKKRIALARTLMLNPKIILYDEPTSGLDPITAKEISELIRRVQGQHHTSSIIITHDMDCANITADRMVILSGGTNYAEGTYEGLSQSDDPKVKGFFL
ncbi:phospholipid/cholesterol/gamma-HCH transport system ATP-binding protein [Catalinimonas alkaloidigena]|uniref:ABC transporter ATP-binding protein n=1 Tax=Catalinimonas alkaloidigena TaxID=1075417 RepID=UPI0024049E16|nr:ATP-binding cassette domain-containing protein [Catalinimonas alkaloidigena]MDF9797873.1 phospholipid/cholesterol/gamma-HCH transport system ATP-binding protein [Catalinimonas alkaloidigena]